MPSFSKQHWKQINDLLVSLSPDEAEEIYGLPEFREKSIVVGTFNIRKLGKITGRSDAAWDFLGQVCARFDLLALQEVLDELTGVRELINRIVSNDVGLVVSDTTGTFPGDGGSPERLAFLFKWTRIKRTELASDITYDRSRIVNTLFDTRDDFAAAWKEHEMDLETWKKKVKKAKEEGRKRPSKPPIELPHFVSFIRQPHCASFQVPGHDSADPYEFLVVNAHLLYGTSEVERRMEFDALIDWLTLRAKYRSRLYHRNLLLLGDCNLEFETTGIIRSEIDARMKNLNETVLKSKKAATANFPLLSTHPFRGDLVTNARQKETYDQIAIFSHDDRLPRPADNDHAGEEFDGYDYGVFNFIDLFANAIFDSDYLDLNEDDQDFIIDRAQYDVSDHMPAWFRLPIPGT